MGQVLILLALPMLPQGKIAAVLLEQAMHVPGIAHFATPIVTQVLKVLVLAIRMTTREGAKDMQNTRVRAGRISQPVLVIHTATE